MVPTTGVRVSRRAFLQSLLVLAVLMSVAGVLTRTVPSGRYTRATQEGREVIEPSTYTITERPVYPVWRWVTAPVEILATERGPIVIVISAFLLLVGVAFAVLESSGIVAAFITWIVARFRSRRRLLLYLITLVFMLMGAFFGTLEEIIILVPVMVALAYSLGWDALMGVGMSVLAANMGFSAAVTNPFTIGVAQHLAGLPLFSGALPRVVVFAAMYALVIWFLGSYARRIERDPAASLLAGRDTGLRHRYSTLHVAQRGGAATPRHLGRGVAVFAVSILAVIALAVAGVVVSTFTDYTLPAVGLVFFLGGLGAALASGAGLTVTLKGAWSGLAGILPAIPLILMAASVPYIVATGGVMDTLIHAALTPFAGMESLPARPVAAALVVFVVVLAIELLVSSGSAKAFLLMPLVLPVSDLLGVTRQVAVTAYAFGDGFTNLVYPTNAALIICLGLATVSFPVWIRWTAKLWLGVLVIAVTTLAIAAIAGFGPF